MNKLSCPNCQEELEFIGKKYCCPCCEREWNEIILKNREFYDPSFIGDLNTILAQEYKVIEDLLHSKQIYGIVFQVKDLYELIIRIPVLIVASFLIKEEQELKAKEFIFYLMSKPLSLGDWRSLLNSAKDVVEKYDSIPVEIKHLIACVRKLVNSDRNGDIVYWRNTTIAHGAAKQLSDSELYDDVASKLAELTKFFSQNRALFQAIKFVDGKEVELEGALHKTSWTGRLFLVINSNKYSLYPFFDLRSEGIYLFDRYVKKLQKTDIVEYIQSLKKSVNITELNNIFIENTISSSEFSTDLAFYTIEERNLCEEFLSSGEFLTPHYLVNWLETKLKYPKNVFLLKMGKGMGKSFFVRGLDPFSIDKIYIDDVSVKAFYINSTYNSRVDDFSIFVEDQMRKITKDTTIANNTFRLDINSDEPSKSFATFLNQYKTKYYSNKKLLFIFDGIDELNQQPDRNILDFIPNIDDIVDGIYVLVTCRECNTEKLSHSCKQFLHSFSGDTTSFTENDEEYLKFVKEFYDLFIIKKSRLFCKRNGISFDADFEKTDSKFAAIIDKSIMNMTLIKELISISLKDYLERGILTVSINDLNFDESLYERYFESIKSYYGSKYYDKFINVLCCLSIVDRPVTLDELAVLSGNNNLNFAFLGFINSMRLFLGTERGEHGTYFTLDHVERKNTVARIFKNKLDETIDYISDKIIEVSSEKFDFCNSEDTVYYLCLNSILSQEKISQEKIILLANAFLKIPAILSWSQNYFANKKELEILKHLDDFSKFKINLSREQMLRVAFLYANAGLDELMFNNYQQSEYYFKKSLSYYNQNLDLSNMIEVYEYVEVLGKYATLLWNQNRNDEALAIYDKIMEHTLAIHKFDSNIISKISVLSEYVCYCNIANSAGKYERQKQILDYVTKEIKKCEISDIKKRTEPFLQLCWFYYYRDMDCFSNAVEAIKSAIDLYSVGVREDVGVYLPDLVKCYNFLFQYWYEKKFLEFSIVEEYIKKGIVDLQFMYNEKGYNDEETYLKFNFLCSLIYLRNNDLQNYIKYKKIAFSFFNSLNDEKRDNAKLTDMIKYFTMEETKLHG